MREGGGERREGGEGAHREGKREGGENVWWGEKSAMCGREDIYTCSKSSALSNSPPQPRRLPSALYVTPTSPTTLEPSLWAVINGSVIA